MSKTKLNCRILDVSEPFGTQNYTYGVFEGDRLVSKGVSSNLGWVRHDAGGYHTKAKFDGLYPDGWEVEFEFDRARSQEPDQ